MVGTTYIGLQTDPSQKPRNTYELDISKNYVCPFQANVINDKKKTQHICSPVD